MGRRRARSRDGADRVRVPDLTSLLLSGLSLLPRTNMIVSENTIDSALGSWSDPDSVGFVEALRSRANADLDRVVDPVVAVSVRERSSGAHGLAASRVAQVGKDGYTHLGGISLRLVRRREVWRDGLCLIAVPGLVREGQIHLLSDVLMSERIPACRPAGSSRTCVRHMRYGFGCIRPAASSAMSSSKRRTISIALMRITAYVPVFGLNHTFELSEPTSDMVVASSCI